MKQIPFWQDTAPSFVDSDQRPFEGRADVVVIGGGFTGLSAARTLAKRGIAVSRAILRGAGSGHSAAIHSRDPKTISRIQSGTKTGASFW